ncbi:MAG TPA: hypothetical protein VGX76_04470, partial [Pirellulales bacterium]|nr:hypothetical protein [Pirellulales bacterium]
NTPHVQVVLEPHSNIQANVSSWGRTGRTTQLTPRSVLEIVQGNEPDPAKATLRERWNVAVPIKHKAWDLAPGDGPSGAVYLYYEYVRGEWQEATPDTPLRTFEARRWNFAAFNHAYGLKP